jgi:multicomponent Na+:H+ antiporter subunit G
MIALLDIASFALIFAGVFFCVVGGIGLLRLPDFFTRTHAAGVTDTMGVTLVLCGLAVRELGAMAGGDGSLAVVMKLVLLMVFIYLTSPTASHALAKAAYAGGLRADRPLHTAAEERAEHATAEQVHHGA